MHECDLSTWAESLDYGLACRVQSCKFQPPSPEATFPALKIKIGYAYKHDQRSHKRLLKGNSSKVVQIDYSFNEATYHVEHIALKQGGTLSAYGLADLIKAYSQIRAFYESLPWVDAPTR